MPLAADLLRVTADDPEYRRQAEAEARFWQNTHPLGLEAVEKAHDEGPVDRYVNERFTGDANLRWFEVVARHGPFRRGIVLGTSALGLEARILETNPSVHLTFLDVSEGALARRMEAFGQRFPGRVATQVADLNFLTFEPESYDLVVSSSTIHHVTNLEHLAHQINRGLTPDGRFFLQDYVGEPRFDFLPAKKRLFREVYAREVARRPGRSLDLVWRDASDLSPFCGLRSLDILGVLADYLDPTEVHTAGTLTVPLLRCVPADGVTAPPPEHWRTRLTALRARLSKLARGRLPAQEHVVGDRFLEQLFLVGDVAADAELVPPCLAFAIYRRRATPAGDAPRTRT